MAEAYSELRAKQNFLALQDDRAELEDQIQLARPYYHGAVREYNTLVQSFPSSVVAGAFRCTPAAYFEIEPAECAAPAVSF